MVKQLFLIFISGILFASCAMQGTIDGGPKDTRAPHLVEEKTFPKNRTVLFSSQKINLYFDEFFSLNNPTSTVFIVPPNVKLQTTSRDKELNINILGELSKETTYAIYLNRTVKDVHEGNDTLITYVFSTGKWIDSITYSGFVIDALRRTPVSDAVVSLYADTVKDYSQKASYITTTSKSGKFEMKYLKRGTYSVITFIDKNKDLIPQINESRGFRSSFVKLEQAMTDSIPVSIFPPLPKRLIKSVTFKGPNQLIIAGNNSLKQAKIFSNNQEIDTYKDFHTIDSLSIYPNLQGIDTLHFYLQLNDIRDSSSIRVPQKEKNRSPQIQFLPKVDFNQPFQISFNDVIDRFNVDSIQCWANDTIKTKVKVEQLSFHKLALSFDKNEYKSLKIIFLDKSVLFKNYKQKFSLTINLSNLDVSSLGTFHVITKSLTQGSILELMMNDKVIASRIIGEGKDTISFTGLEKGNYFFRLIDDFNKNERWDTGNLEKWQQAEEVKIYNDPFIARPNWETEVLFDPKKWR
jgi:uncharacterized protein (DUF2141 family)